MVAAGRQIVWSVRSVRRSEASHLQVFHIAMYVRMTSHRITANFWSRFSKESNRIHSDAAATLASMLLSPGHDAMVGLWCGDGG